MSKRIKVVSVSSSDIKDSLLHNNLNHISGFDFSGVSHNKKSLASVYNRFINEDHRDCILIFVHDDVYISDGDFKKKCLLASEMFDVFGVAGGYGGLEIKPDRPALWHLISKNHAGFAGHYDEGADKKDPFSTCWMTNFGKSPQQVILVDGVFFGVNVEKILEKGLRFDEECPSRFHFYDLLFCVNAKKAGLKIGVFPFTIMHMSHGLKDISPEFLAGDRYFKEYCAKLV